MTVERADGRPSRILGQPSRCGAEGVPIAVSNQRRTVGWKCVRGMERSLQDRGDGSTERRPGGMLLP